ncbi:hypothetical protein I552_5646 [Mycobacterium xenopi 3993]|nr:hypothetical protein I552_5646 [Mycobacterium xenopi 3993]
MIASRVMVQVLNRFAGALGVSVAMTPLYGRRIARLMGL